MMLIMDVKRLLVPVAVAGLVLGLAGCDGGNDATVDAFKTDAAVIAKQHGDTDGKFVGLIGGKADTTLKQLCAAVKAEEGIKVIGANLAWEVALQQAAGDKAPPQTEIGNFSHAVSEAGVKRACPDQLDKLQQMNRDPERFGKALDQSRTK